MSIEFQASNDSFLYASGESDDNVGYPLTTAGWFKFTAAVSAKSVCQFGGNIANSSVIKRDYSSRMEAYSSSSDGGASSAMSSDNACPVDVWVFIAHRRSSTTDLKLYIGVPGNAAEIVTSTSSVANWPVTDPFKTSIASRDIELTGGQGICPSFKIAEYAIWDRVLSDAELDTLKEGASPASLPSNLKGHWATASTDKAVALADQSGNNHDLKIYGADAIEDSGSIVPLYVADHPNITATTSVSATLVQDAIDTPYANKTGLHYTLSSGANVGSQAYIMAGTDGTTDASGVITLSPPGVSVGDKLILNVFDPSGVDIHAADTVVLIGSVQVQ